MFSDFNIILKLDPSEQAAWVDSASISTFIHAPGTPPDHGALYSVRGGASDLVALRKVKFLRKVTMTENSGYHETRLWLYFFASRTQADVL